MAGSRRGNGFRLVLVAGLVVFSSGCGLFGDPIQEQWESRQEYPSCGEVKLPQGKQLEQHATQEIRCLRQALDAGETAELKVSFPTVEGDPIHEYYRLNPDGTLELYIDSTDDANSDQKWSHTDCYSPEWLPEIECR